MFVSWRSPGVCQITQGTKLPNEKRVKGSQGVAASTASGALETSFLDLDIAFSKHLLPSLLQCVVFVFHSFSSNLGKHKA